MTTPSTGGTPPPPAVISLSPEVQQIIDGAVARVLAPLQDLINKAPKHQPPGPVDDRAPITGKDLSHVPGLTMVGVALCKARVQLDGGLRHDSPELVRAALADAKTQIPRKSHYRHVVRVLEQQPQVTGKALSQSDLTAGGAFVQDELMVQEWIELLRNATVIRKAGARSITLAASAGRGAVRLPRQTGAASATYMGENVAVVPSQQSTDQVAWSPKKLMAVTPVSNELIRHAGIDAEIFVRDDLVRVQALKEDLMFIRGTGSADAPIGIRYRASYVDDETVAVAGSATLAETEAELQGSMKKLEQANILQLPGSNPVWLWAANAKYWLRGLRNGLGSLVYEPEMSEGMLKGYKYFSTQQIPENLGGSGDRSELYLVDMMHVLIIDWLTTQVEFFPNGAWANESGIVQSGISRDASVMRTTSEHDLQMRHPQAARVVTALSWGT